MWFLSKVVLASALALFILQNSTRQAGDQSGSSVQGPTSSSSPGKAAGTANVITNPAVASAEAVITVRGLCQANSPKAEAHSCTAVMTREQFENLAEALNAGGPAMSPTVRRNLAKTYTDYVAVEAAAKKAGMEDTPQFEQLMNWVRLRTITDLYRRSLEEKLRHPPQNEIDAYYKEHQSDFEQASLARILVPRENSLATDKDQFAKNALEAAKSARERAQKGDDPAQIQKDVYSALGLAGPPATDAGKRRRTDLVPEESAEVFSLKPGEVSQVETEARNYVIYKLISKSVPSQEEVKSEIVKEIYQRKFKETMKAVIDAASVDLNEQYFGPLPLKAQ